MKLLSVFLLCLLLPMSLTAAGNRDAISDDDVLGILQYVYYWYLDHDDVSRLSSRPSMDVYLSKMEVDRDPGDDTLFTQMLVPALDLEITIKRARYSVAELAHEVRHAGPRIAAIHRNPVDPKPEESSVLRSYATKELFSFFHERRRQITHIDEELLGRLRIALGVIVDNDGKAVSGSTQIFYLGPMSEYSSDLWIFWVQEKKLILFSSDLSIGDAAYWKHLPLYTRIFDLDSAVVTSLSEVPGRNAYVTKGWASRILFNTLIDGNEIQVTANGQ